jgi:hypothetical protein
MALPFPVSQPVRAPIVRVFSQKHRDTQLGSREIESEMKKNVVDGGSPANKLDNSAASYAG